MPQPVQITLSPAFHCGCDDCSTVPARSMPAIIGKRRTTGKAPVVRRFPMIAGIDLAGTVEQSSHPQWKAGDKVICTGWGMGETHLGAYAEMGLAHAPA